MLLVVTSMFYVLYMLGVFYYAARIYGIPIAKKSTLCLLTAINSFLIYIPVYLTSFGYEQLLMLLYFVVLGIELIVVYKQNMKTSISSLLCFVINYFGMRILIIGIFSMDLQLSVNEILSREDLRLSISMLVFGILFPYILVSSRIMISKVVIYVFQDREVINLACTLLAAICIGIFCSIPMLYMEVDNIEMHGIYLIRTGGVALVSFVIVMVILFLYARLKKASITYKNTSEEIKSENVTITALEAEAITDFFTGFFVRSIGINKLKELIQRKAYGYAVYLDIDGLKEVNDSLGHEEGDWYIKSVSEQIQEIFRRDTVSRIGGDEFLVVGNEQEPMNIHNKVQKCFENIIELKAEYEKPYETSISYGIKELDHSNELSCEEIMEEIDEAMYKFKRSRNKERKNTPVRE